MIHFIGVVFVVGWFIFWGCVLLTKPQMFHDFQAAGRKKMDDAAGAAAGGVKLGWDIFKRFRG